MKKKSLADLKTLNKEELIDHVLLNTIKGGCCNGGPEVEEETGCQSTASTARIGFEIKTDVRMICDDDLE